MTYPYKSVSNAIINKMRARGENISPLKLQKMLYYTCGYYLAAGGDPLIDHTFAAWDYGPVVPSLYRHFKPFGNGPITSLAFDLDPASRAMVPVPLPTGDDLLDQVLDFVADTYGPYTGIQLSEMTHADGSPWDITRRENPGIRDADIPRAVLVEHFSQFVGAEEKEELGETAINNLIESATGGQIDGLP